MQSDRLLYTYELQSICPATGAIEILAEADADSAREARPILMRRAGLSERDASILGGYEIAWENGRVRL